MAFDFNAKDHIGWTLLMKTCIDGHKIAFRAIFKHCDIPIYKTDEDRLLSAQQTCRLAAQKSMN